VQDAFFLSSHIEQLKSSSRQKNEEEHPHFVDDKGHYSTKDHSFHLEKDELTLMME
jgi:hypothetical protein